jgi:alkanesulfonate monooxygenase
MAAGWYKREFDAVGVDFHQRGKIMDLNLDILNALMTEDWVTGEFGPYNLRQARMFPKPIQQPRPPLLIGGYVDRVLKRAGVKGDGWLTYFYEPESFTADWTKVCNFAEEAGKDPAALISCNQLPIMVGPRAKVEGPMNEWLNTEWDFAKWSKSTPKSAIMGTPEECVEQLQAHVDTGIDRIIFVPYRYEMEQVEAIAQDIIPHLKVS